MMSAGIAHCIIGPSVKLSSSILNDLANTFRNTNSQQRRIERYKIIYVWKSLENIVPDTNISLANDESSRIGRMCRVPALKPKERKKREESFQSAGPKLFNCLPKSIRNLRGIRVEEFKEQLDLFLSSVPEEPKISGAMPLNCEKSNSLLHQVARGEASLLHCT